MEEETKSGTEGGGMDQQKQEHVGRNKRDKQKTGG